MTAATRARPQMSTASSRWWVWVAAELALIATTISAALMLQRLFADDTYVAPLLFTVIVGHVVMIAMRWLGFGTIAGGTMSLVAVSLAVVATHYSTSAAAVLIPTSATLNEIDADLNAASAVFETMQAPVPAETGFLVVASLLFWVLAFAADWAAFRLLSPAQALLPALMVLVFVSLLGVDDDRVALTARLVVFGVIFVLSHRAAMRASAGVWLDEGPGRGYVSLMTTGAIVALVSIIVGVVGGPTVPGANDAPLVSLGEEGRVESKPLKVISPMVEIKPRLVEQSERVMFTVDTNEPSYWRIGALDIFDGELWRSEGQFRSADGNLDVAYPSTIPTRNLEQSFVLSGLNVVWAPAAYVPTALSIEGEQADLIYEAESATFIVDTNDQNVSDGLRYRLRSAVPVVSPTELSALSRSAQGDIDPRYLSLPADYSPLAIQTARDLTAGIDDPYGQALALQNWFRENFTYDLDVAKGHDIERLDDFLTIQRGYCEQFAGTMASMARAIGLPSRVATGFTQGDPDPANPNRYIVRGVHAHAWPEIYIDGAGWLPFEPTPGRGMPNASYTGVPAQQASSSPQPEPEPVEDLAAATSDPSQSAAPTPTPTPAAAPTPVQAVTAAPELETEEPSPAASLPGWLLIAVAALVVWLIGVPTLKRWRSRRRAARIVDDVRRRITLAWSTVVDRLEQHGLGPRLAETLLEYRDRIATSAPRVGRSFGELTDLTVRAAYDAEAPIAIEAERSEVLAAEIRGTLDDDLPWLSRGLSELDPRPLLRVADPVSARATQLASGATTLVRPEADQTTRAIDPLGPVDGSAISPIDDALN